MQLLPERDNQETNKGNEGEDIKFETTVESACKADDLLLKVFFIAL